VGDRPTVVVVPIKSFALGKQRLSGILDREHRSRLGAALAGHVLDRVASAGLTPLVVSADAEVEAWAGAHHHRVVEDPGSGLDGAATAGIEAALDLEASWIVLHSDLPLLEPEDLLALDRPLGEGRAVIAPSSDGGTSAVGEHGDLAFTFGPGSFRRHLARLEDPCVVTRPGLLLDLDSPTDLFAAVATGRGRWLREVLPDSVLPETTRNLYWPP
jgi:2-phospho-L-lactate guanylyltransferase